ncbi:MAG: lipopolysaccharide heptosyltransferase II [Nitrospinota bacterium]
MSKKVLIRTANWLGDIAMSLPLIEGLSRLGITVDIITLPQFVELSKVFASINRSFSSKDPSLIKQIKEESFDALIVLPNSFRSTFELYKSKIPRRIGYKGEFRSIFLTDSIKCPPKHSVHMEDYYKELFKLFAADVYPAPPSLRELDIDNDYIKDILAKSKRPLIGIGFGAAFGSAKIWPMKKYKELIEKLSEFSQVILFGAKNEEQLALTLTSMLNSPVTSLVGKTSILELSYMLEKLDLYISNDTGGLHLASILKSNTIAIFGPTNREETMPRGANSRAVYHQVDCAPCYKRICPIDHKCMEQILVDDVLRMAKEILKIES